MSQPTEPTASHGPLPPLQRDGEDLIPTHCCFCGMQCGMYLRRDHQENRVVGVEPRYDWPVNEGRLCPKGVVAYQQLRHRDRLLRPLLRRGGRLLETDWETALTRVAEAMQSIQARHGVDAFAVYSGSSMTNEKCYLTGKFARLALGTRHIDYNGRLCMSAAAAAYNRAFGIDRPGCSFTDVLRAEVGLDDLPLLVGLAICRVARRPGDRRGLGAGVGEGLLVGGGRLLRFGLQALGLVEIGGDAIAPAFEDAADARQRHLRHQVVEDDEGDREPQQLRSEGGRVERREHLVLGGGLDERPLADVRRCVVESWLGGGHRRLRRYEAQPNSRMRATRSEKMPSASVTAMPKIRRPNSPSAAAGLRMALAR